MGITEFEFLEPERVDAVGSPANGTAWLMLKNLDSCLSADGLVKYVSAAARRKYADSGVAMPNGDFPIPDEGHLKSAIGRLAEYTGDKAEAKRHIIARARALHLTHLLPEEWHVSKEVDHAQGEHQTEELCAPEGAPVSEVADDGGQRPAVAAQDDTPPEDGGPGDTAPDKDVPRGEADSQTDGAQKADDVDLTGDHADASDDDGGRGEATSQTDEVEKKKGKPMSAANGSAETPGSRAWEAHDIALAQQAVEAAQRTLELARQFEAREKAEASKGDAPTSKEIIDMDRDELIKLLDERDEVRRAAKQASKDKAAKKAAKREAEAAAKAQDGQSATQIPTADLSKSLADISETVQNLQKQVVAIAEQDARPRPMVNAAGVPRGGEGSSVFKELDAAVDNARNETERRDAARRRTMAKLIANPEPGQVATISGRGTPLITNRRALPDDQQVIGV
jgi:hypothetical protein